MRLLFNLATKAWGWLLLGVIVVGLGGFWAWNGRHERVPEFAELAKIDGVVNQVTKVTKTKGGATISTKYEFDITQTNGAAIKLTVSGKDMTESQAAALNGMPIDAYLRKGNSKDVWELSVSGHKVLDYETSRTKLLKNLAWQAENGPYFAGGGALLFLLGGVRLFRSRSAV